MTRSCIGCKHHAQQGDTLYCRVNPPQVVVLRDRPTTVWPAVLPDQFCGAYTEPHHDEVHP